MKWVVENFSEGEDILQLIDAIREEGHQLYLINRKTGFEYKHINIENECVVFYGSINMAPIIESHLSTCKPVLFENFDKFKCSVYWPKFHQFLFNDRHEFVTFGTFKSNKFEYYSKYGKDAMLFIRPDNGTKTFSGQLLDLQDFERFINNNIVCNAKDDDLIIVSTPKNIISEFRFIVSDKKEILGKSCYKFNHKLTTVPGAPEGATNLVKKILDVGEYPARVFAIDIVEDEDHQYWLMEFNSFNSCGLYAADKKKIVKEVSTIALEEYEKNKLYGDV
jgi:hypothetical protein